MGKHQHSYVIRNLVKTVIQIPGLIGRSNLVRDYIRRHWRLLPHGVHPHCTLHRQAGDNADNSSFRFHKRVDQTGDIVFKESFPLRL